LWDLKEIFIPYEFKEDVSSSLVVFKRDVHILYDSEEMFILYGVQERCLLSLVASREVLINPFL